MTSLGQYLRKIREGKKLSMGDVQKATGITDTKLRRIELDEVAEPSPVALNLLANFYGISIIDLFIKAGYITAETLNVYPQIFNGAECLTDEDKKCIQQTIDHLLTKHPY